MSNEAILPTEQTNTPRPISTQVKIFIPIRKAIIGQMTLFCRIAPLQRHRINKFKRTLYTPTKPQLAMVQEMRRYIGLIRFNQPIIVDSYINFRKGHNTGHPVHISYGDTDNLAKGIHDALVRLELLKDDRLIVGHSTWKAYAPENFCLIRFWSTLETPMETTP